MQPFLSAGRHSVAVPHIPSCPWTKCDTSRASTLPIGATKIWRLLFLSAQLRVEQGLHEWLESCQLYRAVDGSTHMLLQEGVSAPHWWSCSDVVGRDRLSWSFEKDRDQAAAAACGGGDYDACVLDVRAALSETRQRCCVTIQQRFQRSLAIINYQRRSKREGKVAQAVQGD